MIKPAFNENYSAIAINCSNEYVPYLAVCLKSLVDNTSKDHNYDIIICEKCISDENKKALSDFISRDNVSIRFINIGEMLAGETFPDIFPGYTIESYAILFTPKLFENYERMLFTDCDLIFTEDIKELYHIDLEGKMACAVRDLTMSMLVASDDKIWEKHVFEELELKDADEYFNSGVMVYDIQKCKEADFTKNTLEIAKVPQRIFIQGILNKFYQGQNIKYMDNKFNLDLIASHEKYLYDNFMDEKHRELYQKAFSHPHVLHWAGIGKPWFYIDETVAYKWWDIARQTPFYETILVRYIIHKESQITNAINEAVHNKELELRTEFKCALDYKKNLRKYIKARILYNLTFGKKREHYKQKKVLLRSKLEIAKRLIG